MRTPSAEAGLSPAPLPGFGPFAGTPRFFGAGEVRLAILSLLEDAPAHGYELIKRLSSRSGGLYRASAGAVYPVLRHLEGEGLVLSQAHGERRVYHLTAQGRREVSGASDALRGIWERAERWHEWGRWMGPSVAVIAAPLSDLVREALHALHAAGSSPGRQERVRQILDRSRRELEEFVRASRGSRRR